MSFFFPFDANMTESYKYLCSSALYEDTFPCFSWSKDGEDAYVGEVFCCINLLYGPLDTAQDPFLLVAGTNFSFDKQKAIFLIRNHSGTNIVVLTLKHSFVTADCIYAH
jgi:hypothetical protein